LRLNSFLRHPYKVLTHSYEAKLKEWTKKSSLTLLYCGSKDGFGGNIFHAKCDNKVPQKKKRTYN
jgi:hypothetical protein